MSGFLHRRRSHDSSEESVWISFSDLMTSLLTIFMLAAVVLVLSLTTTQAEAEAQQRTLEEQQEAFEAQLGVLSNAEQVRAEMVVEIRDELKARGIEVVLSKDNSVLSIPTEALGFDSGSYEIRPEHEDIALTIGSVISAVIAKDDRDQYLDTVFVEGHTDNAVYVGLDGTGNWGLSTFRAINLWQLWDQKLPADQQLDSIVRSDGRPLFSVSGYGASRPVTAEQVTEDQRAENRRIDIRFTETRLSAEEIKSIVEAEVAEPGRGEP